MEAVPKLPMLSFELKTSSENTSFGPKLKQYIADAYREDPESYGNEIHQLEGLRSAAVRATLDASGLNTLIKYFCQLRAMQSRFPMAKGAPAACSFTWRDLYAGMSCSLSDISFEMASILHNIGALHTDLGANEPCATAESLKAACTHFQHAAWAFQCVREQYPQLSGVDVSTDIMKLMQEICFAQAQECILDKSIQDTRKPSVVGAVATQVLFFYRNSLALLGPSAGSDTIHDIIGNKLYNYWYRYLSFKISYIGCIVCLYQGMHAEEQQKMGERVAFYQQALEKLTEARKLAKYIEPVQATQEALTFTNDIVEGKRKAAKNENEFIYHEEVPDKDLLIELKPVCLVKPLPINLSDPEVSGPDLFSRLVPMGAHEVSSLYSEEKAKLLRQVVSQVEVKDTELTKFMSSLQLDQLDVLDSEQSVPQEIVDRCAAMNAKTEIIQTLSETMNKLAETISDLEHALAEIKNLIEEETTREKEYQKVMGRRPASIVQTDLSREYNKYQEAHNRTSESNQVLHKAMTLHIANLKLLAQPLDELIEKIPSIDNIEGLDRETMKEMRRVVGKAREMQTQRESLVQQLRDEITADDITAKLLARGSEPTDDIFKQELEKHTPKVQIIEQNLAAQENIINKLTSLYASYGESRRLLTDVLRKREGLINALITSYDTYEELLGKSQKGQDFYKRLAWNANQLLSRLRSTCQVQEEERSQRLSRQKTKAPPTIPSAAPLAASPAPPLSKTPEVASVPPSSGTRKLKDYLPYMKMRNAPRSVTPQAQIEPMPHDNYYPENIYPTSKRPAPVGSEATDVTQMHLPDGVVMPTMHPNPYERYESPYVPTDPDSYQNYAYSGASKGYEKPAQDDTNYGYNTPYTPTQYGSQQHDQQIYSNPQYSSSHNYPTGVSDSQNPMPYAGQMDQNMANQYAGYSDPYTQNVSNTPLGQMTPTSELPSVPTHNNATNQSDLNVNFSQMHLSAPNVVSSHGGDYTQTYYNAQYGQSSTTNVVSYAPNSTTNIPAQQAANEYASMNYPYNNESIQYGQNDPAYNIPEPQNSYATNAMPHSSQSYPTYTSSGNTAAAVATTVANIGASTHYTYATDNQNYNPTLTQLEPFDQPIKSHVTGQALTANINYTPYQNYDNNVLPAYTNPTEQNYQSTDTYAYPDQTGSNYQQNYQNHPGYMFNNATGNYDYNYGSQNSYNNTSVHGGIESQMTGNDGNWVGQLYTNAGACETMQSPSEGVPTSTDTTVEQQDNNQVYYNTPYGYITTTNQPTAVLPNEEPQPTNYGANVNQSTYMQSGQGHDTNVTYTKNQVSSHVENVTEPNNLESNPEQSDNSKHQDNAVVKITEVSQENVVENNKIEENMEKPTESPIETLPSVKSEPSAFDLLSDIDFTVEHKPLVPEIKVPQISETVIKKPIAIAKLAPVQIPPKEEVIERPAKRDLFSDPVLMNKFTQEVKNLQKLVDSLTEKTKSGLTLLDTKWKNYEDVHAKENMKRSKTIAMQNTSGNVIAEVVPFDDSRLTLKSDPDAYINASHYKQLAPWCIPVIISKNPKQREHHIFWKAVLENKISCVVCLLSEIEMQGKAYFPTAKGQSLELSGGLKVVLEDVTCTVHWTERKLTVASGKTILNVTHYQINVFPAKIACAPLVLLADRVLAETFEGRLSNQLSGACVQCNLGAGRSSVLTLLIMLMCQVRAGYIDLCDMLEAACVNLYKHRSNVLEDTKYLVDAYRTALFYVQGVLCSGTTAFNGEAVSVPTGASVLPPVNPGPPSNAPSTTRGKFSRESFEEMKQSPGLTSGDMKDPLNFLDPLWSLKKK